MALKKCKECSRELSSKADVCPNCGAPQKSKQYGCGTLILIIFVGFIITSVIGMLNEGSSTPSTPPTPSIAILNENYANPSDLILAKKYISELPSACSNSSASVSKNGTVTIHTICKNSDQSTDITMKIKNGKVTELH